MELLEIIKKTISIKSVVGDFEELNKCLDFLKKQYGTEEGIFIKQIEHNKYPSILFSNCDSLDLDVLSIGHIDVVSATNDMFIPKIENGKLKCRGAIDMKSFVITSLENLKEVTKLKLDIKYGVLIVSDEETGGFNGAGHWVNDLELKAQVVLDPDGGQNIETIVAKNKGVVIAKIDATGKEAHGSEPWLGVDANENLIDSISAIRKHFQYYSMHKLPEDSWISTMHVGTIKGGKASNQISAEASAELNFRLAEDYSIYKVKEILNNLSNDYLNFDIVASAEPVIRNMDCKYLKIYSDCLSKNTNNDIKFINSTSASDGRFFAYKGMSLITHQATGGGLHANHEWLDLDSLLEFQRVQMDFLRRFGSTK